VSGWVRVEDSQEAALGAGILAATLEIGRSPWVVSVEADPDQVGAEAEVFVHMVGDVTLRLHVTEVRRAP
jgi:predicted RNA methylase